MEIVPQSVVSKFPLLAGCIRVSTKRRCGQSKEETQLGDGRVLVWRRWGLIPGLIYSVWMVKMAEGGTLRTPVLMTLSKPEDSRSSRARYIVTPSLQAPLDA